MKGPVVALLALCALTLTSGQEAKCSSSISAQCPAVDPETPVYLAVPENCLEYCECSNGVAWLFQCDVDQAWDDSLKR
ncbi:chitin-binding domain-containing protein, partial [Salmonella enterica]|uniref:chitin-binding domain-containing protein n=1 Tax=Salmonella enterica TaxID=28901 RepID=UPI003D7697DE